MSDKTGVVDFARELVSLGWEILSTSGTMKMLKEAGIPVTSVSDVTGFPEICDGRVKTLHPKIHGALLARRDIPDHMRQLEENGIGTIDLVCVNLYPFRETVAKPDVTMEDAIEQAVFVCGSNLKPSVIFAEIVSLCLDYFAALRKRPLRDFLEDEACLRATCLSLLACCRGTRSAVACLVSACRCRGAVACLVSTCCRSDVTCGHLDPQHAANAARKLRERTPYHAIFRVKAHKLRRRLKILSISGIRLLVVAQPKLLPTVFRYIRHECFLSPNFLFFDRAFICAVLDHKFKCRNLLAGQLFASCVRCLAAHVDHGLAADL